MKILFEDSMPKGQDYFSSLGDSKAFATGQINPSDLYAAEALLIRSTTKVDKRLLDGAPNLKFVATATSGTDHMDVAELQRRGISYGSAAGSNAIAVAEYVISCLMVASLHKPSDWLDNITLGIVGAGHVGTALAERLDALKIRYMLCDPPLAKSGDKRTFCSFQSILKCDVISLHVPLIRTGEYPTYHLFDGHVLGNLSTDQLLINASRGEVVDNQQALALLQQGQPLNLMLDVWEGEPNIPFDLVPYTQISTAHIAGHTIEGKVRGTFMVYQQLCDFLGVEQGKTLAECLPISPQVDLTDCGAIDDKSMLRQAIFSVYNVADDSETFKQEVKTGQDFVYSRKHYAIRREFASVRLKTGNSPITEAIYQLGFLPE